MNKQRPSFYAVIPASVRYDKELSSSEKLFYAEITAMSEKEGYCWASNSYFSELFDVSKNTVTRWVSNLKDNGHVVVNLIKDGKQITKREIYPIQKIDDTYPQKSKGGTNKNDDTPTHKNGDDNTTRINTTSNNILVQGFTFDEKDKITDILTEIDLTKEPESKEEKYSLLALHIWNDVNTLQPNNQTTLKATLGTWYHPIRLMVEQDKRTIQGIWKIWKKAHRDDFWKSNLLSTQKLRDKFDQLAIKFNLNDNKTYEIIDALYG